MNRRSRSQLAARPLALGVALSVSISSTVAMADGEQWTVLEVRLPMLRQQRPQLGRMDWRFLTELRVAGRFSGVEQIYFRTGPLAWLTSWLYVGTHLSLWSAAVPTATANAFQLQTELRWDFEPNFFGRLGPITLNSRNRIEYRWFNNAPSRWRMRSQLRVNFAPEDWVVMPFVMEEVLIDLSGEWFNQNRAHVGIGFQVLPNVRVDVAYMNRARTTPGMSGWSLDHAGWINVFVFVPEAAQQTVSAASTAGHLPLVPGHTLPTTPAPTDPTAPVEVAPSAPNPPTSTPTM